MTSAEFLESKSSPDHRTDQRGPRPDANANVLKSEHLEPAFWSLARPASLKSSQVLRAKCSAESGRCCPPSRTLINNWSNSSKASRQAAAILRDLQTRLAHT
ncbi:hypothetical protein WJX73_000068 [Symbiochloris irregularis]|uniref:Uncharacterized protein n=1 Tax=Symbiochloris irregularis TaxID=706552 RepID=A0AAW1NL99_9CHLO